MKGVGQEKVRHESFPNGLPMPVSSELIQHPSKVLQNSELSTSNAELHRTMRLKKVKMAIALSLLLVGGVVLVSLWVNLRERDRRLENAETGGVISTGGADQRLEKIHFVEEKHGQKIWELEAKSLSQYQDQNLLLLEEVTVIYYSKDGRTYLLNGNRGKVHQETKDMELVGNVKFTSAEGYQLTTHSISYQHSNRRVKTSDPIELEGEQIHLTGVGMVIDLEARTFKVLGQVKTQWKGGRKG